MNVKKYAGEVLAAHVHVNLYHLVDHCYFVNLRQLVVPCHLVIPYHLVSQAKIF